METWRYVHFPVKQAWRFADLSGVADDLEAVETLCERFIKESGKKRPDMLLCEALCTAALVKFGRAHGSGVRTGVPKELVDGLPTRLKAAHQQFRDLRNKWIAHSVNALEENRVVAYLMPKERGAKSIHSVSVQRHRVLTLSVESIRLLCEVSATLRHKLRDVIDEEKAQVLAFARSLPVEPFYAADDKYQPFPRVNDPGKTRKRA